MGGSLHATLLHALLLAFSPQSSGAILYLSGLCFFISGGGGGPCRVHLCSGLEGQGGFSPWALPSVAKQRKAAPLLLTKIAQVIKGS